jgi:hypothetical protein
MSLLNKRPAQTARRACITLATLFAVPTLAIAGSDFLIEDDGCKTRERTSFV